MQLKKWRKFLVASLSLCLLMDTAKLPTAAQAATKNNTKSTNVYTEKTLLKVLKMSDKEVINLKNSKSNKDFVINVESCDSKSLNIYTQHANLDNYTKFANLRVGGSDNTYVENADNDNVRVTAKNSVIKVTNDANLRKITFQGKDNVLQTASGSAITYLVMNKDDASLHVQANGEVKNVFIRNTSNLIFSGTCTPNIQCSGEGSTITCNNKVTLILKKNASVTVNEKASNSTIQLMDNVVANITNNSNETLTIETSNGKLEVASGVTQSVGERKETTGDDVGFIGGFGGGDTPSSGNNSSNQAPTIQLSKIELDCESSTLSNDANQTQEVVISTYSGDSICSYITSNSQVSVQLKEADLDNALKLTDAGIASNPSKYYTINRSKVIFMSEDLPIGTYVYMITVGGKSKEFKLNITGTNPESNRVLLPYINDNKDTPFLGKSIDAVVNTREDANLSITYALYDQVGECTAFVSDINEAENVKYEVYLNEDSISAGNNDKCSFVINSLSENKVSKIGTGNCYCIVTVSGMNNEKTIYQHSFTITDSQAKVTLRQTSQTAESIFEVRNVTGKEEDIIEYYYNSYLKKSYSSDLPFSEMDNGMVMNTVQNIYLKNALLKNCSITMNGNTYQDNPRVDFISNINANVQLAYKEQNSTSKYANPISQATIKNVTVYLDVAHWGNSNGGLPLFVPFEIKNANLTVNFDSEKEIKTVLYSISTKAIDFKNYQMNTYVPINGENFKMFFKVTDAKNEELTRLAMYNWKSKNPKIVRVGDYNDNVHSVDLFPTSQGSTTIVMENANGEVLYEMPITVGDFDSNYELKLSTNEITLNHSIIDSSKISYQIVKKNSGAVTNYMPANSKDMVKVSLKRGTTSTSELDDSQIAAIQTTIDNNLYQSSSATNCDIVYFDGKQFEFMGTGTQGLEVGSYEFEVTLSGVSAILVVNIEPVDDTGTVTYALFQDSLSFDLATIDPNTILTDEPLVIKVVKRVNGKNKSYVDAEVTFKDERLLPFYNSDTNVLQIAKAETVAENRYNLTFVPTTQTTFTVTYQNENLDNEELTGTINITNSKPCTCKQMVSKIQKLSFLINYYDALWNPDTHATEEEVNTAKEEIGKIVLENISLENQYSGVPNYSKEAQYDYTTDEKGTITGMIVTSVTYKPLPVYGMGKMLYYPSIVADDLNYIFTFE